MSFIDEHCEDYGVEPICSVLPIAPSTYYEQKARQRDTDRLPPRAKRDAYLREEILRVHRDSFELYGVRKAWRQLNREGIEVARCTVARLMREMGLAGAVRGRRFKTTIPDESASRPPDLVDRDFSATRPNQLWVSDLERHEAFLNPAVVKGHRLRSVAAGRQKLRAARAGGRR